jgi:integrase
MSYIFRRGASYYARLKVPVDLVELSGNKKELVKALGTKDREEAKRLVMPVIESWRRGFDDMRERRNLSEEDKASAIWEHYETTLEQSEQRRRSFPTAAEIDAEKDSIYRRIDRREITSDDFVGMINAYTDYELMLGARTYDTKHRERRLTALTNDLISSEIKRIAPAAQKFINDNRLFVEPQSEGYRDLCNRLIRAEIEALKRTLERDEGNYAGEPQDPIVKPTNGPPRAAAEPGQSLLEVFEQYTAENPNQVRVDTLNQARRDISLFVQHVGRTYPVRSIDKKNVREWKALLLKYPVKAAETKTFQGMSLGQIVQHNEKVAKPTITRRTVNRHLSSLGAYCKWLVRNGYLDQNPVEGMALNKEKHSKTLTFTPEQMNVLFRSPLFVGCQSDTQPRFIKRPGNVQIRDHRYWVPLVMLFSGARPGEIAQLAISDIRNENGTWIIHITDDGGGEKSVKNENSKRILPIHTQLVELGFIDYHAETKGAGHDRLFPNAERNSRGQMIADFSRMFSRYLTDLGIKNGRGYSQYSFRHGAADALRRAGFLDHEFKFLMGHGDTSETGRYGMMPQGMLEKRAELINAISYPGLDLEHLKPPQGKNSSRGS